MRCGRFGRIGDGIVLFCVDAGNSRFALLYAVATPWVCAGRVEQGIRAACCPPAERFALASTDSFSPAATHFLCFAKESKQRKATARRCPSGSRRSEHKSGKRNQLASLRHVSLLIRLAHRFCGSVPCGVGQTLPYLAHRSHVGRSNPPVLDLADDSTPRYVVHYIVFIIGNFKPFRCAHATAVS